MYIGTQKEMRMPEKWVVQCILCEQLKIKYGLRYEMRDAHHVKRKLYVKIIYVLFKYTHDYYVE